MRMQRLFDSAYISDELQIRVILLTRNGRQLVVILFRMAIPSGKITEVKYTFVFALRL